MARFLESFNRTAISTGIARHAQRRGWFDLRLGFALLRDRRVSRVAKLAALTSGFAVTGILMALEVPLESIVSVLVPVLGPLLDIAFDGLEVMVLPLLVAAVFIRPFVPKHLLSNQ